MFVIGDKVVYPMHGAGVIESIEIKKILGADKKYYVLRVPFGEMKIMVPCESCQKIGVREIISEGEMTEVLETLSNDSTEMSDNWNRRNRDNLEKLKTGEVSKVAEVVRNLMRLDNIKKLSTGEKKMLSNAKQILISEMILVKCCDEEEASVTIEKYVMKG